jgi:hypothetical protein
VIRSVSIVLIALFAFIVPATRAADRLVLDLDIDQDLVSLAHNIDGFLFNPTMNFSPDLAGNLASRFINENLKGYLSATALVRIDGKVAGFATEQEVLVSDPGSGHPVAESAWLITLNYPGATGFLAVKQTEDAGPVFSKVQEVMQNPGRKWEDKFLRFLSTVGTPAVQLATDDLAVYQGGRFEEYNFVNPADFGKYGRFRARLQFVIYPAE